MKRILLGVLTLLTIFSLSSCNNKPFERGEILDHGYKTEYFGFEITLSEDYSVVSKEEIDKYNEEQTALMTDFFASSGSGTSVNINYHKKMTKKAKELSRDQLTSVSSSFESAGFNITKALTEKIKVAGKKRHSTLVSGENNGLSYTQRIVFLEKGDYICYINITGINQEEIEEILGSIQKI